MQKKTKEMYVTEKISNSGKKEWEKCLGIEQEEFIFTTVAVEAGRGEWSLRPINLLLCDRRRVGRGEGVLASEPITS
jgi:hypothetical protein